MASIANKINKLKVLLNEYAYEIRKDKPSFLSQAEIDALVCEESAMMLNEACKHLTSTGTKF